jgi:hypothetical protein
LADDATATKTVHFTRGTALRHRFEHIRSATRSRGVAESGTRSSQKLSCLPNHLKSLSSARRKNMATATFVFMIATYWIAAPDRWREESCWRTASKSQGGFYRSSQNFAFRHYFARLSAKTLRKRGCEGSWAILPKIDLERRIDLSYAAAKALDMLHDGRKGACQRSDPKTSTRYRNFAGSQAGLNKISSQSIVPHRRVQLISFDSPRQ